MEGQDMVLGGRTPGFARQCRCRRSGRQARPVNQILGNDFRQICVSPLVVFGSINGADARSFFVIQPPQAKMAYWEKMAYREGEWI
jgi:hypothetical protein